MGAGLPPPNSAWWPSPAVSLPVTENRRENQPLLTSGTGGASGWHSTELTGSVSRGSARGARTVGHPGGFWVSEAGVQRCRRLVRVLAAYVSIVAGR